MSSLQYGARNAKLGIVASIIVGAWLMAACTITVPGRVDGIVQGPVQLPGPTIPIDSEFTAEQIVDLLPPDAIRAIDDPRFVSATEANLELSHDEPILGVVINGDARAYSLSILSSHEIVNDTVGGEPVAITWCPLCYSALVFGRHVDGRTTPLTFGVSGKLLFNTLVMFDRETDSLWSQLYGVAISGPLTDRSLAIFPATVVEWSTWSERFPRTQVLSKAETRAQFNRAEYAAAPRTSYAVDPYASYYRTPYEGVIDYRIPRDESSLQPKRRVIGVRIGESARAYPYSLLKQRPVINDLLDGTELLVWFDRDSEAGLAYERRVAERALTFAPIEGEPLQLVDLETNSVWDPFLGIAVEGALKGEQLLPVVASSAFEFGWIGYFPHGDIFQLPDDEP